MPDDYLNLPAVPDPATVDGPVYDGEIVSETIEPAAVSRPVPAIGPVPVPPYARTAARHGAYVWAGAAVVLRRWNDKRTLHQRMGAVAASTGDHEVALKWAQQHALEQHQRSERRRKWVEAFTDVVKVSPLIGGAWLFLMLASGGLMAYYDHSLRGFAVPWKALAAVVALMFTVWTIAMLAGPPLAVVIVLGRLYYLGRTARGGPGWAVASKADTDLVIDEMAITQALAALGITRIRDYLKDGLPLPYLVPCRMEGRGTYAEVRLPKGVTAEDIARRRPALASGLYRLPKEVWPSTGADASHLKLWIADKGALEEGAGPYPLLEAGFTDVFKGLPFGKTLRGDPQPIPVIGRNTICGGMPEQGKSSAARAIAAGYALDIRTELRIYIPDTNFDFEHFRPRCSRYVMGAEDEFIEQILGDLEELKDEVQERGQKLVDHEQPEVTPHLARMAGLHPVFVLIEEAHVAIQHRKYGKDISQLLCDIVKLDRKRGIHLMVSTQAPTKDSMPRDVTRNCSNGIAFAVGDHVANDALLGQGAYAGGHRATELIPGTDRGTALCKGFSGQRSEVVQVHFLSVARGNDQVSPLVERALAEMTRRGRVLPGTGRQRAIESRDLLADLDAALGVDRVRLADVPALLRDLAPHWGPYRSLNGARLRELLDDEGVRTTNVGNVPRLDPEDLRRVLAERGE